MCDKESVILKIREVSNLMKRCAKDIIKQNHQYEVTSRHIFIAKYLHKISTKIFFKKI